MKLGFLGTGTMGAPMAARLLGAEQQLVVCDTSEGRVSELVALGASRAATPVDLGAVSDLVFVSLPNASALESAVLDPDHGVLSAMRDGSTLVDLSTNSLALTRRVQDVAQRRAVHAIDSPVSSVSGSAAEGLLTLMIGGADDDIDRVSPILGLLGKHLVRLGAHGAGTVGKLLTQQLALTNMVAGIEAMTAAAKADVDMQAMLDLVSASIGDSFMFKIVNQLALARDFGDPGHVVGLVEIMNKDLQFSVELAEELGTPHSASAAAAAVFAAAMDRGFGPYHYSRVAEVLEELAGVQIEQSRDRGED